MKSITTLNLIVAFLAMAIFSGNAQEKLICTTHSLTNEVLKNSPEARADREQLEREYEEYLNLPKSERAGGVKVIPTVIHVIHDGGSENLSKESILSIIDVVNDELQGQNPNLTSVIPEFEDIIGNPQFELRLAKIDPNGNCTDGITRTQSEQTYEGGEGVKSLINWNGGSRRYLQVWLVQSLSSGAGGYTYLPSNWFSAQINGIIIRAAQFQGSLAHEFGHWMNLDHTWGGTNEPGLQSNCNGGMDDGVSDTPNTIGTSGSCNLSQETCGSLDNVQNHMDYSTCARMFTAGQASRMQSAANSDVGERDYYWGSTNRANTGTNDGYVPPSCAPEVSFTFEDALGCEGLQVQFDDVLWGADEDASWEWSWEFPGGTPATSSDENPTITYNAAGTYDVTLTVNTSAGSNSNTVQNAVVVNAFGGGIESSLQEGVENSNFPDNNDPMYAWEIESSGGFTWQRNDDAAFTGNASVAINLRNVPEGDIHSLISPPIDMSNVVTGEATLTFRVAHANRTSASHDERLRVYASRNCGESWSLRYTETGDDLNTAGSSLVSSTFVPTESQWREEEVNLNTVAGDEHVLIKFEALSDRQSYLYIDDININPNYASTGIKEIASLAGAVVYPNPVNGTSQLELSLTKADKFTFTLFNVVGKQMATVTRNLDKGINRIMLNEFGTELTAGFYFIQMNTANGQKTVRFVKN